MADEENIFSDIVDRAVLRGAHRGGNRHFGAVWSECLLEYFIHLLFAAVNDAQHTVRCALFAPDQSVGHSLYAEPLVFGRVHDLSFC